MNKKVVWNSQMVNLLDLARRAHPAESDTILAKIVSTVVNKSVSKSSIRHARIRHQIPDRFMHIK